MSYSEKVTDIAYNVVASSIKKRYLNEPMDIIQSSMEIVEKDNNLNGVEKREIVKNVLLKIVNATGLLDSGRMNQLKSLLDSNIIESVISTICKASKGLFKINKKCMKGTFSCCLP
jgi:hypothetical protein